MTARRKVATINDETLAVQTIARGAEDGPLGNLQAGGGWPRNDLPFVQGGAEQMEANEEDRLNMVLSEVGSSGTNAFISIWKLNDKTKQWEYVDRKGVTEFENDGLPFLAKTFGAGEYELRIYDSNKKIHSRPKVTVSQVAAQHAQAMNAPAQSAGSDVMALARMTAEGFQRIGELLATRQTAPVESRSAFLAEMLQMKQLFSSDNKGGDSLEMFSRMLPIFKSLQPRAENENPLMGLAEQFLPVIMEGFQDARKNQPAQPAATPGVAVAVAHPAPAPARQIQAGAPANLSPEQQGAKKMSMMLSFQLGVLCTAAAKDSDPDDYAGLILDNVTPEVLNNLFNNENWLATLTTYNAKCAQFPEWFGELKEAIEERLKEDAADESLTQGNGGAIQQPNHTGDAINVPGGSADDSEGGDES